MAILLAGHKKTMKILPTVSVLIILKLVRPCITSEENHPRQKRLVWVTGDGRLALPPGTSLVVSPSLSMPFVRYPPDGFFSNMTVSIPFTIDFSKLGLTDNENPYGTVPQFFARTLGRAAGGFLRNYIGNLFSHRRDKRSAGKKPPEPPPEFKHAFHGGERALLYTVIEDFLENFGMDGRACLLRAICETHARSLENYGLLGEFAKLILSASKSPFSELLFEYVEAENMGKGKIGPSECWPYMKACPKSLFKTSHNYNRMSDEEHTSHNSKVTADPSIRNM